MGLKGFTSIELPAVVVIVGIPASYAADQDADFPGLAGFEGATALLANFGR